MVELYSVSHASSQAPEMNSVLCLLHYAFTCRAFSCGKCTILSSCLVSLFVARTDQSKHDSGQRTLSNLSLLPFFQSPHNHTTKIAQTSTSASMASDIPLPRLVQSLPRELFDEIFDLVFTTLTSTRVTIDKDCKPPSELQVNHFTRKQFAQVYFRDVTFIIRPSTMAQHWLDSMPVQHLKLVNRIHMLHKPQLEIDLDHLEALSATFFKAIRNHDCGRPGVFRIIDIGRRFRGEFSLQANESNTRARQKWLAVDDAEMSGTLLTKVEECRY